MPQKVRCDLISHEVQTVIRKKGDVVKQRLRNGMAVTVEVPVLAFNTGQGMFKAVYLKPGMMGTVYEKSSPKVTYSQYSQDPNGRRTTMCLVDFIDPDTGETYRCSPNYNDIVIPKKGKSDAIQI